MLKKIIEIANFAIILALLLLMIFTMVYGWSLAARVICTILAAILFVCMIFNIVDFIKKCKGARENNAEK